MYKNNFVLTILRNGKLQKEMDGNVGLPFGTEYKIRLKNKNCRQAMAKVFIDNIQVCSLGDFVIGAGSSLDLERFVETSLARGKKFKFVSLDHSEVDDPTSSENGIVKVEFRLEKQTPFICFDPVKIKPFPFVGEDYNGTGNFKHYDWTYWCDNDSSGKKSGNTYICNDAKSLRSTHDGSACYVNYCSTNIGPPESLTGATVGGGDSNQQFYYASDFNVEDIPTVLTLKLVSSGDLNNKKVVSTKISKGRHCTACGRAVKSYYRYCSNCGCKLG